MNIYVYTMVIFSVICECVLVLTIASCSTCCCILGLERQLIQFSICRFIQVSRQYYILGHSKVILGNRLIR